MTTVCHDIDWGENGRFYKESQKVRPETVVNKLHYMEEEHCYTQGVGQDQ